jgi:hypothetical protein
MEFDVVAEKLLQRMVSGHRDLVAARALGGQDGFIGTMQKIRVVIASGHAGRHSNAHRPGNCPPIYRQTIMQHPPKPIGK